LSSGKACVLNNLPDGIYSYNPDFKSQSNNLRISLAPAEQTVAEERDVEINIAKDRQYQVK
jgi:hypothetical protein